jgi:pimeloyl-ACP methyl ester carboxylesterase
MALLAADGVALAFDDVGPRDGAGCVVLIHGFASNRQENWRRVGWLSALERRRYRAIAFDLRGHGESGKPHDPHFYRLSTLAGDVAALMDHLGVRRATVMGYSMGARIALAAAIASPQRFERLILGGVGGRIFEPRPAGNPMADAMEATHPDAVSEPLLRSFRMFADNQGEDRLALAAFARGHNAEIDRAGPAGLRVPTLIVAGARDELAGDPDSLAGAMGSARSALLPGCDHFSAIAHALYKAAVFDFLEDAPP